MPTINVDWKQMNPEDSTLPCVGLPPPKCESGVVLHAARLLNHGANAGPQQSSYIPAVIALAEVNYIEAILALVYTYCKGVTLQEKPMFAPRVFTSASVSPSVFSTR
jgi:hypothetical protein